MLCRLLARRWCRRHALQRSPTCLALTGRCLLGKVHVARRARHGCWGGVAARWKVRYACYTHMIAKFRPYCKFYSTTIYCVFQLKIAHFRRFEHNILWWQEKIHTSHKKLYKITAIFQLVFVLFAHNPENTRYHALCAVLRWRLCIA